MTDQTAISVAHISKIYKLYDQPKDRLKESLHPFKKKYHHEFHALNDINFTVKKGETVGILGKNGAGKSTLLKIITGVLTPSSGMVTVNGKIASLLELGAGFNPEYTGLENVYFQGTLMGFTREEMAAKVEAIVEFADIGEFIHQPVKMYSSGMFARLAFSVSINVEPDVLIVDEALSVGDAAFQQKCFKQISKMQASGCAILLVSHDLASIINFCSRGIIISEGKVLEDSVAKVAVGNFKKLISVGQNIDEISTVSEACFKVGQLYKNFELNPNCSDYGEGSVKIVDWGIINRSGNPITIIENDEMVEIVLSILFKKTCKDPIVGYFLTDLQGREIVGTNTQFEKIDLGRKDAGESITVKFRQVLSLAAGIYSLNLGCSEYIQDKLIAHHRLYDVTFITISSAKQFVGLSSLNSEIIISLNS